MRATMLIEWLASAVRKYGDLEVVTDNGNYIESSLEEIQEVIIDHLDDKERTKVINLLKSSDDNI